LEGAKQTYGSLTLGGYDSTRLKANQSLSLKFAQTDVKPLMVGVQSILASDSLNGTASMTFGTNGHMSLIDSGVPELWLPTQVAENFASSFGLFYDNRTNYYIINSTMHDKWTAANPSFTFKLGTTAFDDGNSVNIILPYQAFEHQLGWPIYSPASYYFPIRRAANDTQYVLGRALLQQTYLIVDQERKNFTIAQAEFPDTSVSPHLVAIISPNTSTGGSSLGTGAIVGIAVGGVVVIALAVLAFFCFRRRRKGKDQKAKIAELEAKDRSYKPAYHKVHQDGIVESGGDEVQELPGSGVGSYKHQQEQVAELETRHPAPLYEMEGDSTLGSWARSPGVSSPGESTSYSPGTGRPSPAKSTPSPLSPRK
jgi:hypothetical protein